MNVRVPAMPSINRKWDKRFLALANFIASWSKDPSTKVGAVIVDHDKRIVSTGYNGFPRGVNDSPERYADRDTRLKLICHAERNAILFARQDLKRCTLYTTFEPCAACTGMVIQAGIDEVVAYTTPPALAERWRDDILLTHKMFAEANVLLRFIEGDRG